MMGYLTVWILTVTLEFFIILIFIKDQPLKILVYSILINSVTLPIATYSYNYIFTNFLLIETVVFLAESVLLMLLLKIKYPKALLISLTANFVTAIVGLFLSY
jgi:hypothetical protein